jgi:uncharacterized membrane protein
MSERAFLIAILWFFSSIVLGALFISAAAQGELTILHSSLALAIIALVVFASLLLTRWKSSETEEQKAKRQHIDTLLRDMSDEQLVTLKKRLASGELDDEQFSDYLESDGELVGRK